LERGDNRDSALGRPVVLAAPQYTGDLNEDRLVRSDDLQSRTDAIARSFWSSETDSCGVQTDARVWDELPGAADEAKNIQTFFPEVEIYLGTDADIYRLQAVKRPRFLHLATHGFSREACRAGLFNPMSRSGLVLAGGSVLSPTTAITSGHFATLDLEGTELVTLSACTSGLGASLAGQGVFGLRRAIRLAGARAQLMSLWSVDDRATQHFMAGF